VSEETRDSSFSALVTENLHGGGAERQTHPAGAEGCAEAGQAGGAQEVAQSPGNEPIFT